MGIASPVRKNARAGWFLSRAIYFEELLEWRIGGFSKRLNHPMMMLEEMQQSLCMDSKNFDVEPGSARKPGENHVPSCDPSQPKCS
jgi:hypothetical protein